MNDNVISLDKHRQDKAGICPAPVTPSPEEAAQAAVAAQTAVDQEERSQMHMVLVDAITKVLDTRPLSTENRLEIARTVVRSIMGHGWRIARK